MAVGTRIPKKEHSRTRRARELMFTESLPATRCFTSLIIFNSQSILGGRYFYYFLFTNGEVEAQKGYMSSGHIAGEKQI